LSTCATLTEWPAWGPTKGEKQRLGVPGLRYRARKIRWARAPCTVQGQQEILYRIRRTDQPEDIGQAISSGFIRIANGDVIDQAP